MEIKYKNLFEIKANTIKPLNLRIQNFHHESKIIPKIIQSSPKQYHES